MSSTSQELCTRFAFSCVLLWLDIGHPYLLGLFHLHHCPNTFGAALINMGKGGCKSIIMHELIAHHKQNKTKNRVHIYGMYSALH